MRIVVIGGTGLVGRRVVDLLTAGGHEAVVAAPSTGVDAVTGAGLTEVLTGADVVVDVANSPTMDPAGVLAFFRGTAENIAKAESAAGVRRHVLLSIVGTDRVPGMPYYLAKVAQEEAAATSSARLTVLRATQFFEFAEQLAGWTGVDGEVHVSGDLVVQPVAVDDIAATLADLATADNPPERLELAGPDEFRLAEFVRATLAARGDARTVVAEPGASILGVEAPPRALVPAGDARIGAISWEKWLGDDTATITRHA